MGGALGSTGSNVHPLLAATVLGLVIASGCRRGGVCDRPEFDDVDPHQIVGSDVLRFRGHVPRNLLFVSMDTFRRDHHGAYGKRGLTPFLDQIAREGVVMANHQQCSNWTWGSTTCTLAGRTNVDAGFVPTLIGPKEERTPVPEGTRFLAGHLADAGFVSALVTNNSWMSKQWGNTQGYTVEGVPDGDVAERGRDLVSELLEDHPAADRWFMHIHYMEPHAAYAPPDENVVGIDALEPWPHDLRNRKVHYKSRDEWPELDLEDRALLERHLRLLYEGEIRTLDQVLEKSWKELEKGCWLEDTLVVFWSDHGEQFWEDGYQTHAFELKWTENDGILVFWSPNIVPGRYRGPTSAVDLVPTLLDLYGLPIPPEVTGVPIGEAAPDRPIFADAIARRGAVQSVTRDGVKLHFNWSNGEVRVWDRNSDPFELVDLFDPADPLVLDLWDLLVPQTLAMEVVPQAERLRVVWPAGLPTPPEAR